VAGGSCGVFDTSNDDVLLLAFWIFQAISGKSEGSEVGKIVGLQAENTQGSMPLPATAWHSLISKLGSEVLLGVLRILKVNSSNQRLRMYCASRI
jgi:hypothetical protein